MRVISWSLEGFVVEGLVKKKYHVSSSAWEEHHDGLDIEGKKTCQILVLMEHPDTPTHSGTV
jgi:hypothetical protein